MPTDPSARDPRKDPRPGDVLRDPSGTIRVTLVGRRVHYEIVGERIGSTVTKKDWREWCSTMAEVLHVEE